MDPVRISDFFSILDLGPLFQWKKKIKRNWHLTDWCLGVSIIHSDLSLILFLDAHFYRPKSNRINWKRIQRKKNKFQNLLSSWNEGDNNNNEKTKLKKSNIIPEWNFKILLLIFMCECVYSTIFFFGCESSILSIIFSLQKKYNEKQNLNIRITKCHHERVNKKKWLLKDWLKWK